MSQHSADDPALAAERFGGPFGYFITRLGYQALLALGVLENPVTGHSRVDLTQARLIHADLRMLQNKTRGNLTSDESDKLSEVLGQLEQRLEQLD
jgi:hypothetical protein